MPHPEGRRRWEEAAAAKAEAEERAAELERLRVVAFGAGCSESRREPGAAYGRVYAKVGGVGLPASFQIARTPAFHSAMAGRYCVERGGRVGLDS